MTQSEKILQHLKTFGWITQAEAAQQYNIWRIGARIWDLRHAGHPIKTEFVNVKNKFGERSRYARYTLKVEKKPQEGKREEADKCACNT